MTIDIDLAWSRVKKDLRDRHFISPLHLPTVLEKNLNPSLENIKKKIESKSFQPSSMEIVDIPKGNGLIRSGSLLTIEDNIAYTALV